MLFSMSIQLAEKGFGSQERCLVFITAFKGNMKDTEKALSSIMFNEANEVDDDDDDLQLKGKKSRLA